MKTNTTETQTVTTDSGSEKKPLKLSLRTERVKNLAVRAGVKTGCTCHQISVEWIVQR